MIIDAHHHVWDPADAPEDYVWLSGPYAALHRVFTVDDLRPDLAAAGVGGTVIVQTRPSLDESRAFLALAGADPIVLGVVAWVDLTAPDVGERVAELRAGPGGHHLAGIRHQVHDEADPEWLGRADVRRGLREVESAGLVYDLCSVLASFRPGWTYAVRCRDCGS